MLICHQTNCFVSVVTAVNQEVLSGTDAVVISCQVTGLTVALGTVKWTDSTGDDVTTLATKSSYTVNEGTLQGGKSQTTTLTVASAQTGSDATYSCLITPGSPDDTTEVSTSVALKVYSKSLNESICDIFRCTTLTTKHWCFNSKFYNIRHSILSSTPGRPRLVTVTTFFSR